MQGARGAIAKHREVRKGCSTALYHLMWHKNIHENHKILQCGYFRSKPPWVHPYKSGKYLSLVSLRDTDGQYGKGSDATHGRQGLKLHSLTDKGDREELRLHSLTEKGNREGLRLHPVMDRGAREGLRLH